MSPPTTSAAPEPGAELIRKFEMATDPESTDPEPDTVVIEEPAPAAKHPSWLNRAARKAGFGDDDLAELSTDDLKEALVFRGQEQRQTQEVERAINSAGRPYDPQTGQLLPTGAPAPVAPPDDKPFTLTDLGLDPKLVEGWDEFTRDAFTAVLSPLVARLKQLEAGVGEVKSGLGEVSKRELARQHQAVGDKLDKLFAENEAVFGKGTRDRLKPDSNEFTRRMAVIREMDRRRQLTPDLSFDDAFEAASKALYGAAGPAAPAPTTTPDTLKFEQGQTHRPTNRNGVHEGKPGASKAVRAVEEMLKDRASIIGPSSDADDLPE